MDDDLIHIRGGEYRASMLLYVFSDEFEKRKEEPVYVSVGRGTSNPLFWQGEDPRLYRNEKGELMVQATIHSPEGLICLGQGTLCRVDGRLVWNVQRIVQSRVNQKNWAASPLTRNGRQLFLSHVYPKWCWTSLDVGGVSRREFVIPSFGEFTDLRCTSGCVDFRPNTLLTCLHSKKPYKTFFCEIDKTTLLPLNISPALDFSPEKSYIEFCSGLEVVGEKVYLGVGINDAQFEIYLMDREEIVKTLVHRISPILEG